MTEPGRELPFVDLAAQRDRLGDRIDKAIARVLDHGRFIQGPEVLQLEEKLKELSGAQHVVSCASGTDALLLPLMALNLGPGDAVIVPAFTFPASAEVVALLGATPVFADVREDTYNADASTIQLAVETVAASDLNLKAIMTVDLFGQPATDDSISSLASELGVLYLSDAAQSVGGSMNGRSVGALADVTATSFFPAKPLGCYGDGGAIFTDNDDYAEVFRSLRVHGKGKSKYHTARVGVNARLDTIQAAVLLAKLEIFQEECRERHRIASRYTESLNDVVRTPLLRPGAVSAWAQYTVRLAQREDVSTKLKSEGVPTAVYYPVPLHRQLAFERYPIAKGGLPTSERLSEEVLSLPIHPYLTADDQERVISSVRRAVVV